MRREYVPVGKPAKRYSPSVSVGVLRFNPVPPLKIVTLTPGTTAPLGSVTVPETVASWVCDHAPAEKSATNTADNVYSRKFRRVISLVLYEFGCSAISLASSSLSRDPLAEVWIAIRQRNARRFAPSKKSHAIVTGQSQLLEVKNDAVIFPFRGDESFQLGNV